MHMEGSCPEATPDITSLGAGMALMFALILVGCQAEAPEREATAKDEAVVRYILPVSRIHAAGGATHPDHVGGRIVSDPTTLLYDQRRVREHLHWLLDGIAVDGVAVYTVLTPDGPVEFTTGFDAHYLGDMFRAADLLAFLKERLNTKTAEKEFHIVEPELVKLYRERMAQDAAATARRLAFSPWDRDTVAVISLLSHAGYVEAESLFMQLTRDNNQAVRHAAVLALGRIAPSSPAAMADLKRLLSDSELQREAIRAMAMADEAAVPAMIEALDHSDELVRNRVVHAAPRMDPEAGKRLLLAAMRHRDEAVRGWAVSAVIDMQGRREDIGNGQIVDALAALLRDENHQTRRSAALALQNLGPAAVQAIHALRDATGDANPDVARAAARALRAIEGQPKNGDG